METSNLWMQENWVNQTENCSCGESEPYETFTDSLKKLFRSCQKEYGKCVSKMFVDRKNGTTIQTGWVFEKVRKYENCNNTYVAETWVSVYKKEPVKECIIHAE